MEMFVPQIMRVDEPPSTSASEVFGSRLEKVAASELGTPSRTGNPFSSTKTRRRRAEPEPDASEWISPRLDALCVELPCSLGPDDRTKRPLLLLGISDR